MFSRVLLSTILGSIIAYAWLCISWMALPYHAQHIHQLKDEQAVLSVIKDNTSASGIYHSPYMAADKTFASPDEEKQYNEEVMQKMASGPTLFISYSQTGRPMLQQMLMGYGTYLIAAFYLALMMLFVARHNFFCRLGFVVIFALTVGVLSSLPEYIWWQFDLGFVTCNFVDCLMSWGLAGFVMALVMKRKEAN